TMKQVGPRNSTRGSGGCDRSPVRPRSQKMHPPDDGLSPVTYSSRQGDQRCSKSIQNAKCKMQTVNDRVFAFFILNLVFASNGLRPQPVRYLRRRRAGATRR